MQKKKKLKNIQRKIKDPKEIKENNSKYWQSQSTYINRLIKIIAIDQGLRQRPHRGRQLTQRHRKERGKPRPPVAANKDNVRPMQGLTLIEYQKVPIQSANPWLITGSSHQLDDSCDCCVKWSAMKNKRSRENKRSRKNNPIRIIANQITTYINRQKSSNKRDTDQSWPIKDYDKGLTRGRQLTQRHRKERGKPRPPVAANKDNVRPMQGLTLIEYQKVPIQSANPDRSLR